MTKKETIESWPLWYLESSYPGFSEAFSEYQDIQRKHQEILKDFDFQERNSKAIGFIWGHVLCRIIRNYKKMTKAENALANQLVCAAFTRDIKEIERLLKNPTIKKLFRCGVFKTCRTVLSFDGDPDLELKP